MNPRTFIERFWATKPVDQLFVCMPFDKEFDSRYSMYEKVAKRLHDEGLGFEKGAYRVDFNKKTESITTEIFHGIANSRFVLIDLNDDPRLETKKKDASEIQPSINDNVIYEAGIARTIREPESILMIRKTSICGLGFDIRDANIQIFDGEDEEEWLYNLIKNALENKKWTTEERIRIVKESLDELCLGVIRDFGVAPKGKGNFFLQNVPLLLKSAIHRLLDLGLLRFNTNIKSNDEIEYSFWWTDFGYSVIEELGFEVYESDEEFKKKDPVRWQRRVDNEKHFKEGKST